MPSGPGPWQTIINATLYFVATVCVLYWVIKPII